MTDNTHLLAQLRSELAIAQQNLSFWQAQPPVFMAAPFSNAIVPGRIQGLKVNIADIEQAIRILEADDARGPSGT